jgi:hypothetical protein
MQIFCHRKLGNSHFLIWEKCTFSALGMGHFNSPMEREKIESHDACKTLIFTMFTVVVETDYSD